MPLSSALPSLGTDIENAYKDARDAGSKAGAAPGDIIATLADGFGNAVHNFMLQALVTTDDQALPGQMVTPSAASTASPGTGTGTGNLE